MEKKYIFVKVEEGKVDFFPFCCSKSESAGEEEGAAAWSPQGRNGIYAGLGLLPKVLRGLLCSEDGPLKYLEDRP
jgi:hypothetical protein